jgi:uncharacterized membrane-anchored protein
VTVLSAGTYIYDYNVYADEPGSLVLQVNGVSVSGTTFGRATGTSQIIGHGLIILNANDVVTLVNSPPSAWCRWLRERRARRAPPERRAPRAQPEPPEWV